MPDFDAGSPRSSLPANDPVEGVVVPADRWAKGAWLFRDETLNRIAFVLDEAFRVPFTGIRFGIDGIIGLIPGIGDLITGIASCVIVVAAWFRGVPYVTLVRMMVNLGLDVLIGAIPFLGDAFDIAWKANRRNYRLLTRHLAEPRRHTWKDWAVLLGMLLILMAVFLAPLVVMVWLARMILHRL